MLKHGQICHLDVKIKVQNKLTIDAYIGTMIFDWVWRKGTLQQERKRETGKSQIGKTGNIRLVNRKLIEISIGKGCYCTKLFT